MCGIVGVLAFGDLPKDKEAVRQEIMQVLSTELMLATEPRGKDATGAVILFKDGNYYGVKRGTKVSSFLAKFGTSKETYGSLLDVWKKTKTPVKAFVGHCRATTKGSTYDNNNNHPIKVGNIVGIHNGTLKNDDEIFKNLECKRDGNVDSEAIFRLAAHYTNNGEEPFTMDVLKEIVHRLDGSFSVIMFNADNPYQIPVFRDGRPMEFIFIRELALLIIVSDKDYWDQVHFAYERMAKYYEYKTIPSLLPMKIEKGALDNDGAAIFDLTTNVEENTVLKDLAEWEKLLGTGRIWKTQTTTSYYNRNIGYGRSAVNTTTPTVKPTQTSDKPVAAQNGVKRHVFDEITKKYTIKVGDVELNGDESANINVDETKDTNKVENQKDEAKSKNTETKTEVKSGAKIIDLTEYAEEVDTSISKPVVNNAVTKSTEVKIVNMEQDPPALIEAATTYYKELPKDRRGFDSTDQLLDAAEIKDEETAKRLGLIHLANRVFRYAWKAGFVAGCKYAADLYSKDSKKSGDIESKTKKREQHIVGLKSLVVLLAQYFNKTMTEDDATNARRRLSTIAMGQENILDIEKVENVFNGWELDKLIGVKEIVKQAAQTTASSMEGKDED